MREFLDVFMDDLSEIPPKSEIDFSIHFLLDTNPILIPPYWMSPEELKELKVHFKDLLDKVFIQPCISPWGASIFFVKKKLGPLGYVLIITNSIKSPLRTYIISLVLTTYLINSNGQSTFLILT